MVIKLILICGIPNSGKTTYSQKFHNVIHLDEVQPINQSHIAKVCEIISQCNKDIVIEGVCIDAYYRQQILNAAKHYDIKKCIWLNTPLEICLQRENRNRALFIIKNCYKMFKPPIITEGWDEIEVIEWKS